MQRDALRPVPELEADFQPAPSWIPPEDESYTRPRFALLLA